MSPVATARSAALALLNLKSFYSSIPMSAPVTVSIAKQCLKIFLFKIWVIFGQNVIGNQRPYVSALGSCPDLLRDCPGQPGWLLGNKKVQ